jgi:hypothetical protein
MNLEIVKGDTGPYYCVELDGRLISFGLNMDEARRLVAEWQGQDRWVPSWRFPMAVAH